MVLLLPLLAGGADGAKPLPDDARRNWVLVSDRQQIQVFQQGGGESGFAIHATARFPLPDEYALVALLDDYPAYPGWLHFVTSVQALKPAEDGARNLRLVTRLPWPLHDREALLESRVVQTPTPPPGRVTVALTNRPHLLPPDPRYVRVPHLRGSLTFQRAEPGQVRVDYRLHLDPGGAIPDWLARLLLRDAAHFTLRRLGESVRQPRYQGHYYSSLDLRGPGRPPGVENVTKPQ